MALNLVFIPEPATDSYKEASSLCAEGVLLAEAGKLQEALEVLSKGVLAAPERAASYNDRAQLLRLMQKDDGMYYIIYTRVLICRPYSDELLKLCM